jgi:hypothetical protein
MLPVLKGLPADIREPLLERFFGGVSTDPGYRRGDERTQFGLMQSITAVARDQRDPEVRWRLEELGGGVPVLNLPAHGPRRPLAAVAADLRRLPASVL